MKIDEKAKLFAYETRMFQRIAGVPETSEEELIQEYIAMKKPHRERALVNIIDNNILIKMASIAAKERNN